MRVLAGLVRLSRPRQWLKNVLVLAAPLAGGQLFQLPVLLAVLVAMAMFVLASVGVYMLNDVIDVDEDRLHPTKCQRPVASGQVPAELAVGVSILFFLGAVVGSYVLTGWELAAVIGVYIVLQVAYGLWLKHQPVTDLALVASGFLLRAMAGGVASHIFLSPWFMLVTAFGSLFMVSGKRYSEKRNASDDTITRKSLTRYSVGYLRFVWAMAATAAVVFYALWALLGQARPGMWQTVSIAPFVLALLRYAVDVDEARAEAPEDLVMGDRWLQLYGALWFVTYALGVYWR